MQVLDCLLEAQVKKGDTCVIVFPSLSPSTPAYVMPAPDHDDAFKASSAKQNGAVKTTASTKTRAKEPSSASPTMSDPSHNSTYEAERARECDTEQVNDTEEELDGVEEDLKTGDGPVAQGSFQPPPPPTPPPYEEGGSPGGAGGGAASEVVGRGGRRRRMS